jgi:hypothetical protein
MIPVKVLCDCGQKYAFDVEPVNGRMASTVACPACGVDGTAAANTIIARSLATAPLDSAAAPINLGAASLRVSAPAMAVASSNVAPTIAPLVPPSMAPPPPPAIGLARMRVSTPTPAPEPAAPALPAGIAPPPPAAAPIPAGPPKRNRLPGQLEPDQAEHEARAKILWGDAPEDVIKFMMLHGFTAAEARPKVFEMFQERVKTVRSNGIKKIGFGFALICVPIVSLLFFLHLGILPLKLFGLTVCVGLYGCWLVLNGVIMVIVPKMQQGDANEN